jgi:hypothetical protein
MISSFLSAADADRALSTLRKLAQHDISNWAITGGLAVEIHRQSQHCPRSLRFLNDVDFVTSGFDCIPKSLAGDFLFRHVHPLDPPGKTLLQLIDAETSLRVDVFRAFGATLSRTNATELDSVPVRLISLEDLVARAARLALDLAAGQPVASKYAHDYLRLAEIVDPSRVETAWRDQRRSTDPTTFDDADALLQDLIPTRSDLLITPNYSKTPLAPPCPRCLPSPPFQLADPEVVLSLIGYC